MGLLGPLRGEPMLFLRSLVGEGGAGFPICRKTIHTWEHLDQNFNHFKTPHTGELVMLMSPLCRGRPGVGVLNRSVFLMWLCRALAVKDQLLMDVGSHAWSTAEQSQAITLVLLYTELSIKAAFIMLAWKVMRERRLREIAPQTAGQLSVTVHEDTACQKKSNKQLERALSFSPARAPSARTSVSSKMRLYYNILTIE